MDSLQRVGVTHWKTETKIVVRGRSGKLALGLVDCPIIVGDEPSAWDVIGGQELIDSLITSSGKTKQLLVLIGTLAPGVEGGWWRELVSAGSQPGIYVQSLAADPAKWNQWREVLRVNPVAKVNPILRGALRRELDEAKRDSRAKARFLSFRLNIPSADEVSVLLTVDEYERVLDRDVHCVWVSQLLGLIAERGELSQRRRLCGRMAEPNQSPLRLVRRPSKHKRNVIVSHQEPTRAWWRPVS